MRTAISVLSAFLLFLCQGCEEIRPSAVESNIFGLGDDLMRDMAEDPYEAVDGDCCNDYSPFTVPGYDTMLAHIRPGDDLDFFDLQIVDGLAGQLLLDHDDQDLILRIFNRDMAEYDYILNEAGGYRWTTLVGMSEPFTILIQSPDRKETRSRYILSWTKVVSTTVLDIEDPDEGDRWRAATTQRINWDLSQSSEPVNVDLIKGPVIVDNLKDKVYDDELDWEISGDLIPGNDYRILIYLTNNPTIMDISDAFEIY